MFLQVTYIEVWNIHTITPTNLVLRVKGQFLRTIFVKGQIFRTK